MSEKVFFAFLACLLLKFVYPHQIDMAEALIYISLAFCVLGYWSFAAWLRIKEKESTKEKTADQTNTITFLQENVSELEDNMKEMKTKMNAMALRLGFQS